MDGVHPAGGSQVLAGLIDDHGEVIVSDLLHYYGVDLREIFLPEAPFSPRYVLALLTYLPMDSAFFAANRGGQQFRGWDAGRYALVDVANTLRSFQHMYLAAHIDRRKTALPRQPEPFPTPELQRTKKAVMKPGSFAHMVVTAKKAAAARKRKAGK